MWTFLSDRFQLTLTREFYMFSYVLMNRYRTLKECYMYSCTYIQFPASQFQHRDLAIYRNYIYYYIYIYIYTLPHSQEGLMWYNFDHTEDRKTADSDLDLEFMEEDDELGRHDGMVLGHSNAESFEDMEMVEGGSSLGCL